MTEAVPAPAILDIKPILVMTDDLDGMSPFLSASYSECS